MAQRGRALSVRFWGVRGAIAAPGPETVKYGGNTPCVEIRAGDEVFILDCGTGMRDLGNQMAGEGDVEATILISRYEWDHIQGFPFFSPAFMPGNSFTVLGHKVNGSGVRDRLSKQMDYPCFPVKLADLGAKITFKDMDMESGLETDNAKVTGIVLDDRVVGFKFAVGRKRLAYLAYAPEGADEIKQISKQVRGTVLIYALPQTETNGRDRAAEHWEHALELADMAKLKQIVLFHHDPAQDDESLTKLERRFRRKNKVIHAAFEGMAISL